ncbi:MAG: GH92 family glycosyl hydrolase, partial [Bifidobacteriaceae bacterium]|nr:GH92 family glycosyl hydrolase [Bifidobacteriaceae bacterium]
MMFNLAARPRSRRTVIVSGLVTAALVATSLAQFNPASAAQPLIDNPASYVNTLAGTAGSTNNFPGPALPFGMVQFSPDTSANNSQGAGNANYRQKGYSYPDTAVRGFGMTHASQGCGMGGDFPILPTAYDNLTAGLGNSHPAYQRDIITGTRATTETAIPGYYRVPLRDTSISASQGINIVAELTATARGGIGRFTFPANTTRPKVFLKPNQTAWSYQAWNSEVHIDPATGIVTARVKTGNFCRKGESHDLYYALAFDQAWAGFGTWTNGPAEADRTDVVSDTTYPYTNYALGQTNSAPRETGAYFTFPDGTEVIQARVAISYTSAANAVLNLNTEIPTLGPNTFNTVRQAAWDRWNAELRKVRVSDAVDWGQADPTRDLKTFYTALYHSITHPATMSDVNGEYLGFETTPRVHNVSEHPGAGGRQRVQYTQISDWDTYRCLVPFQAALWPTQTADQVQSLVNAAEQMGSYPQWTVANGTTNQMNGDNVAPLIAFAHAFGATDFDTAQALRYMVEGAVGETAGKYTGGTNQSLGNVNYPMAQRPGAEYYNTLGYAPQVRAFQADHMVTGGSYTLEYSLDDLAVSEFAKALGNSSVASQFLERSHYWQNLFNPTANTIQPRDINGLFPDGTNAYSLIPQTFGYRGNVWESNVGQQGFEEGSGEQYLWLVPQNLAGLIDALGGKAATEARLDTFMSNNFSGGASYSARYMNLDNEPNFQVPWIYNYLGVPRKASEAVDKATQTLFGFGPSGAEPGNDDLGALANWFVWSALGMYPMTPGTGVLALNAPMFDQAVVQLGNGKRLTINAPGAQDHRQYQNGKKYIAGMEVNGVSTTKSWIDYSAFSTDTTIDYQISTNSYNSWGTGENDLPPSWRGGHGIVANVAPQGSSTAQALTVAPGATAWATVAVQRIESKDARFTTS